VTVQLQEIGDFSRILNAAVLCQGLSPGASMEKIILLCLIVGVIGALAELSPVPPSQ
jgi:hypothetical protein